MIHKQHKHEGYELRGEEEREGNGKRMMIVTDDGTIMNNNKNDHDESDNEHGRKVDERIYIPLATNHVIDDKGNKIRELTNEDVNDHQFQNNNNSNQQHDVNDGGRSSPGQSKVPLRKWLMKKIWNPSDVQQLQQQQQQNDLTTKKNDAGNSDTNAPSSSSTSNGHDDAEITPLLLNESVKTISNAKTKVFTRWKDSHEMNNVILFQELIGYHSQSPIQILEFSKDGAFMASAGHDGVINIWSVLDKVERKNMQISIKAKAASVSSRQTSKSSGSVDKRKEVEKSNSGNSSNDKQKKKGENNVKIQKQQKQGEDDDADDDQDTQPSSSSGSNPSGNSRLDMKFPGLFHPVPYRSYKGHTSEIVSLSWSNSLFLLSASVDRTVRLWHTSRDDCLCIFEHPDVVSAVSFHPRRDYYFVSASFDQKLRLWNIPDGKIAQWTKCPGLVTSCSFNTDGSLIATGLVTGQCLFYRTDELRYFTQIECKRQGSTNKVSSIKFVNIKTWASSSFNPPSSTIATSQNNGKDGNIKSNGPQTASKQPRMPKEKAHEFMLITTNDSRIRLYSMDGFYLVHKYKGHLNSRYQIGATCSDDARHIMCGSEDQNVYIWRLQGDLVKGFFSTSGKSKPNKKTQGNTMLHGRESSEALPNTATGAIGATSAVVGGPVTLSNTVTAAAITGSTNNPTAINENKPSISSVEVFQTRHDSVVLCAIFVPQSAIEMTNLPLINRKDGNAVGLEGTLIVTSGTDGKIEVWYEITKPSDM